MCCGSSHRGYAVVMNEERLARAARRRHYEILAVAVVLVVLWLTWPDIHRATEGFLYRQGLPQGIPTVDNATARPYFPTDFPMPRVSEEPWPSRSPFPYPTP
jgi:hypothetical protein